MPPRFTPAELTEIVQLYFEEGRRARRVARIYSAQHPDLPRLDHRLILRTVRRFQRTGNVQASRVRTGGPQAVRSYNFDLDMLLYQMENPHSSVRNTAHFFGCSKDTVHRTLRHYNFKPFRSQVVQGLRNGDEERRLTFIAEMDVLWEEIPSLFSVVLWTDESTFTNNGLFNRWNFRTWASENPRLSFSTRHQVRFSVNVWCGLIGNQLIGPHFFNGGSLNGERYLEFLREILPELLEDVPLATRQVMWFQQDGCPAHNAQAVTRFVNGRFGDRWIGNRSPIAWPARSPDLSPLDFFLWGHLKDVVYAADRPPIASNEDLQERILDACASVKPLSIVEALTTEWWRRAGACVENNGRQFEHLLEGN